MEVCLPQPITKRMSKKKNLIKIFVFLQIVKSFLSHYEFFVSFIPGKLKNASAVEKHTVWFMFSVVVLNKH